MRDLGLIMLCLTAGYDMIGCCYDESMVSTGSVQTPGSLHTSQHRGGIEGPGQQQWNIYQQS